MRSSLRSTLATVSLLAGSILGLQGCVAATDAMGPEEENVNPSRSDALTMPICGSVLGSFDGTEAYSNADDTGTGESCNGRGAYGLQYQCVELVMRHFKTHWGLSWSGHARSLLANAPASSVDVHENGDGTHPPVPGDMIVWTNGDFGHVALVTAMHADSIDILEQNVKGDGKATLPWDGAHIGVRWKTWVPSGWAHARANGSPPTDGGGSPGGEPSNGGSWDCGQSSYHGNQFWTCSGGSIHRCENGVAQEQTCQDGCQTNAVGTDDACKSPPAPPPPPPPPNWNCSNSAYQGNQYWTCSGGNAYRCEGGVPQEQICAAGCKSNPIGTNDVCK